jgi:hypothetical protein
LKSETGPDTTSPQSVTTRGGRWVGDATWWTAIRTTIAGHQGMARGGDEGVVATVAAAVAGTPRDNRPDYDDMHWASRL